MKLALSRFKIFLLLIFFFGSLSSPFFVQANTRQSRPNSPSTLTKTITPYNFRRYVRPQLSFLIADFYKGLTYLNPLYQKLNRFKSSLGPLFLYSKEIKNSQDLDKIQFIIKTARERQRGYYQILMDKRFHSYPNFIIYYQEFGKIIQKLARLEITGELIEQGSEILKLAGEARVFFTLAFFELLTPKRYSPIFHLWQEFISPVEDIIHRPECKQYIGKNYHKLYKSWNLYHHLIDKEQLKVPLKYKGLSKIGQNRWNSILKIIL